ncbi:DUF6355 family natural product biosynthesis protein [Streptomyces sp. NPDC054871]
MVGVRWWNQGARHALRPAGSAARFTVSSTSARFQAGGGVHADQRDRPTTAPNTIKCVEPGVTWIDEAADVDGAWYIGRTC